MNLKGSNIKINKTPEYTNRLETLKSETPSILSEYERCYVLHNGNTANSEYKRLFDNINGNLVTLEARFTTLSNDVEKDINEINKELVSLNTLIENEKTTYKNINLKLGIAENKNNASTELISDYKQMYEYGYLRNWGLFFSIIFACYAISKVSKTNPSTIIQQKI
jgi:hypothetical protein